VLYITVTCNDFIRSGSASLPGGMFTKESTANHLVAFLDSIYRYTMVVGCFPGETGID